MHGTSAGTASIMACMHDATRAGSFINTAPAVEKGPKQQRMDTLTSAHCVRPREKKKRKKNAQLHINYSFRWR